MCVHVCHCFQKSEKSFQVGGENVILQGEERLLPASFTYILIFPRGERRKKRRLCTSGSLRSNPFTHRIFNINGCCAMPERDSRTCRWSKPLLLIRFAVPVGFVAYSPFAVVKVPGQPDTNVLLQAQKDRGMALSLDEINLPEIYRPTLKPKRKNAASTYSQCSPLPGRLAS